MQEIINRYSLVEQLASKQLRATYLGYPVADDQKRVVIKMFESEALNHDLDRRSSQAHMNALEQLVHPSICAVLNIGIEGKRLYVVNEYCSGGSLRAYLKASPTKYIPWQKALHIVRQIGEALEFAHRRSLLHGSVKPENVLCRADDSVLLTDFSLAPVVDVTRLDYKSDIPSMRYMAPERFMGTLRPESDQYALACLAYEMVTGVVPFNDLSFSGLWKKHASEYVLSPSTLAPDLPEMVDLVILKALSKKPEQRYGSLSEFVGALLESLPHTLDQSPTEVTLSAVRVTGDLGPMDKSNAAPCSPDSETFQSFDVLSDDLSFLAQDDPVQPPVTPDLSTWKSTPEDDLAFMIRPDPVQPPVTSDPPAWKSTPEEEKQASQPGLETTQNPASAEPVADISSDALLSSEQDTKQLEKRTISRSLPHPVPAFDLQIDDDLLDQPQNVRFFSRPLDESDVEHSFSDTETAISEERSEIARRSAAPTKRFPLPSRRLHSGSFLMGSVFSSIAVLLAIVCIPLALHTPATVAVMNNSHNTTSAPTSPAGLGRATLVVFPTQRGQATGIVNTAATSTAPQDQSSQGNGQSSSAGAGAVIATSTVASSGGTGSVPATPGASAPTVTVAPSPTSVSVTGMIRINTGGGAVDSFAADTDYDQGAVCQGNAGGVFDMSSIADGAPDTVFRSNRCGSEFTYTVSGLTPSHTYTVRLLFAETYWNSAGRRVFDVMMNNQLVLTNFDIFATAGAAYKAIEEQFLVQPTSSGTIAIYFDHVVDNAQVNGIEVLA